MASMRTLNRRLDRWQRYARRTCWNPRVSRPAWCGPDTAMAAGHIRAWNAREFERERRECRASDLGAWWGADDVYDDACCLVGDVGHDGPCQIRCSTCLGDGRCPWCRGEDDLGCHECGGTGSCPDRCEDGVVTEDDYVWMAPRRVVTVDTGGLT